MEQKLEIFRAFSDVEMREVQREDGTKAVHFRGKCITFNQPSVVMLDEKKKICFREYIAPTALSQAFLDRMDIIATRQHNPDFIVARKRPLGEQCTMTLTVDDDCVWCEFDFPDSQMGRDLAEQIRRRDLSGMSFMFTDDYKFTERKGDDGIIERTITSFGCIFEVTIAAWPAYPSTTSECREQMIASITDANDLDAEAKKREAEEAAQREAAEREKFTREATLRAMCKRLA